MSTSTAATKGNTASATADHRPPEDDLQEWFKSIGIMVIVLVGLGVGAVVLLIFLNVSSGWHDQTVQEEREMIEEKYEQYLPERLKEES